MGDRKLGELLVAAGILPKADLEKALEAQRREGGRLGQKLLELGLVTEPALLDAFARHTGLPHADLGARPVPGEVQRRVRLETVRAFHVLPLDLEGKTLLLGMVDPTDGDAIVEVEHETGLHVRPAILPQAQFDAALAHVNKVGWGVEALRLARPDAPAPRSTGLPALLGALVARKGQDLHLTSDASPAIRLDGELVRLDEPRLSTADLETLIVPHLTETQRRLFDHDRELDFAFVVPSVGRFRCNLYRQRGALAFTARHVAEVVPSAAELGLPPLLKDVALRTQGLVLIAGPNGHGKSTTLAWMIDLVNRERAANIVTIEDPVEFVHHHRRSNVNQREVGSDTRSFSEGLRHVYRQNPDVIVIGELRDRESIATAVTAAETGHLVFGTIHALSATAAIDRILDVFPAEAQAQVRTQLADALLLSFSQRLLKRASGKGRVLAWEAVGNSARVRNSIREGKPHLIRSLMQSNLEELHPMEKSLAELVAHHVVTHDEAVRWAESPGYLDDLIALRQPRVRA